MSQARTVLVTLPHDGDRGEVVRERGEARLVGSARWGGGTVIGRDRLVCEGVGGGRFVVGGLLPAGATRAVVIQASGEPVVATSGDGAWLAVVAAGDGEAPPVRFDDDDGRPVRPPLPEAWTREPVADATEPCPACGATTWERVTPTDFSRGSRRQGSGPEEPSPVIVCTRCGHEEGEGSWFGVRFEAPAAPAAPEEQAAIERHRERIDRERLAALDGIGFTMYAPAGGPEPELCGWGGPPGRVDHATVCQRGQGSTELRVESASARSTDTEDPLERAREAFFSSGPRLDEGWPELSQPARALWLRARRRAHVATLLRAEPFTVEVAVDGVPVRFTAFRGGDGWTMAANLDGARVTITGTGRPLDGVALRTLETPADDVRPFR